MSLHRYVNNVRLREGSGSEMDSGDKARTEQDGLIENAMNVRHVQKVVSIKFKGSRAL